VNIETCLNTLHSIPAGAKRSIQCCTSESKHLMISGDPEERSDKGGSNSGSDILAVGMKVDRPAFVDSFPAELCTAVDLPAALIRARVLGKNWPEEALA